MAAIKHLFHINAPRQNVYSALTQIEGLSNWWTTETSGESKAGGVVEFRFSTFGVNKMLVKELKENETVAWQCVDGPPEWIGNRISFKLDDNAGKTRVRFVHDDWKEANDFYASCCFSWGRYMESLRQFCQTGIGEAFGSAGYRK